MTRIIPSIWCNDTADDMAALYTEHFPDARIVDTSKYPTEGLLDFQQPLAGKTLTIDLEIGDTRINLLNGGPGVAPNPSISFMLNFQPAHDPEAREHLDALWAVLSDGGTVMMPLDAYPHSAHYGWLQDRFGVSWQFMLTTPEADPRPFMVPSLMFSDENANKADPALQTYVDLFADSHRGTTARYPEDAGDGVAGSLMYGDALVSGVWLAGMDAPSPQGRTFDNAVSLIATCADQDEIDRYWSVLSQDPDSERCGWCRDAFGVSWQIVPADMDSLMKHPGAFDALMQMGRIVIADLVTPDA
jgi:predicted 3-demethylubiquinone-9 3-methyltransferase (glyoxalase superfamily)